jgi:hypothetical protein
MTAPRFVGLGLIGRERRLALVEEIVGYGLDDAPTPT